MNRSAKYSSAKHNYQVTSTAFITGLLLAMPSCCIPKLRCPLPGQPLPQSYNLVPHWSDGTVSANKSAANGYDGNSRQDETNGASGMSTASSSTADGSNESASFSKRFFGFFKFVGLSSGSKSLEESQADDSFSSASLSAKKVAVSVDAANNSQNNKGPISFASFVQPANAHVVNAAAPMVVNDANLQIGSATKPNDGTNSINPMATDSVAIGPKGGPVGVENAPYGMDVGNISFENSSQLAWCDFFNDTFLVGLIDQALSGNQELRILNEDIQIAYNEVQARRGSYFPFLSLGTGAGLEKSSRFTREGAVEDQLTAAPGKTFPAPLPNFLVAANVSWEIDIWRRLRNARDAATLRYLGTRDGRNYVVTRMVAEVAENYYELLALDNRLIILDQTIQIQEQSLLTASAMKAAARGTELGVQRFQAEVRKNQSEKLIIQQQIVEAENRINFLLGRFPQAIERMSVDFLDLNLQAINVGVPSQLLRNRSDIRRAERELQAAGLDVKVARARFYPALILNGGVGYRAFNPKYIFESPDSLIYNVAGDLVAPVLNRKAIKADYMSANARQLQAVYDYQRTILNAFTEVINSMAKAENYRQSIAIKKQQLESLQSSVDNATKLFQNARAEYIDVLLSQRDLMEAKVVTIETKQQQLAAVIKAYQALGGGGVPTR